MPNLENRVMKAECNPLLRSWNEFIRLKHRFYRLRRHGRARLESECPKVVLSKKGRR